MRLFSIGTLLADAEKHPEALLPLKTWYRIVRSEAWKNLEEVKEIYRDAEAVGNLTVFNIKGNKYRLIVSINYEKQRIYYKYFLTHAEYDKDKWKNDPYF
jgi:mRNA interferase HigB